MGAFGRFKKAKVGQGAIQRFEIGKYLVKIDSVKFTESRKREEMFTVEFTVVKILDEESKTKVGAHINYAAMGSWDDYLGRVKEFICKAYDSAESEIDEMPDEDFEELVEKLTGPEQAATGRLMEIECIPWKNKEGKMTTVVRLFPVSDEDQGQETDEVAAAA